MWRSFRARYKEGKLRRTGWSLQSSFRSRLLRPIMLTRQTGLIGCERNVSELEKVINVLHFSSVFPSKQNCMEYCQTPNSMWVRVTTIADYHELKHRGKQLVLSSAFQKQTFSIWLRLYEWCRHVWIADWQSSLSSKEILPEFKVEAVLRVRENIRNCRRWNRGCIERDALYRALDQNCGIHWSGSTFWEICILWTANESCTSG